MKVLGLMSGTSADGVDAVLARFDGPPRCPRWRILSSASLAYPQELRMRLLAVGQGGALRAADVLELAEAVTEQQALAARECDPSCAAELIGCHGQTLWHRPPEDGRRGASWQLLQGPELAEQLARPVVFDFRAADLALGGQGAPLVPPADAALLGGTGGWRAVLNLGGIANLTLIPPACGPDRNQPLLGWDCGPANSLLDLAVAQFSEGRADFDSDGLWARSGRIQEARIGQWLQEPYFQVLPPKSTGRELFGQADLERRMASMPHAAPEDVLATLTAFTAELVAQDLSRGPRPLELLVAGGGARNGFLMEQLQRRSRGMAVLRLADRGIADQQREALAFALLAWWHHLEHPGSRPSVTGATRATVLGVRACPSGGRAGKTQPPGRTPQAARPT